MKNLHGRCKACPGIGSPGSLARCEHASSAKRSAARQLKPSKFEQRLGPSFLHTSPMFPNRDQTDAGGTLTILSQLPVHAAASAISSLPMRTHEIRVQPASSGNTDIPLLRRPPPLMTCAKHVNRMKKFGLGPTDRIYPDTYLTCRVHSSLGPRALPSPNPGAHS